MVQTGRAHHCAAHHSWVWVPRMCVHACTSMWIKKGSAAMLAVKRSAGVTRGESEESVVYRQENIQARESNLILKPREDVTRSPKQGYQWPHKKDWCSPKISITKTISSYSDDHFLRNQCLMPQNWCDRRDVVLKSLNFFLFVESNILVCLVSP